MEPSATDDPGRQAAREALERFLRLREDNSADAQALLNGAPTPHSTLLRRADAVLAELQEIGELIAADERDDAAMPAQLGRFKLLHPLGAGGLSRVFLGYDPELDRKVAIKVLRERGLLDRSTLVWIRREGRSLAQPLHRGVVRVLDTGVEADGIAWLAMEHVDGPNLAAVIARLRRSATSDDPRVEARAREFESIAARCRLLARLADALDHCHRVGVLHRDIKPGNVLVDGTGHPVLIDFGLAHVEHTDSEGAVGGVTESLVGTAAYLAPEQVDADRVGADARSDQFALGILAYELLALRNPFESKRRSESLDLISRCEPPPLRNLDARVPIELEQCVMHCLERAPERRYASVADFARDLEAVLELRPISLPAPTVTDAARRTLRKHRRALALAAAGVVVLALTWMVVSGLAAARERSELAQAAQVVVERVDATRLPAPLLSDLHSLESLRWRAERYERDNTWSRWLGFPPERIDAAIDRLDARVAELIAEESAHEEHTGRRFDPSRWRTLLDDLHRAAPGSTRNDDARTREHVLWPEPPPGLETRLYAVVSVPALQQERVERREFELLPGLGRFRWLALDPLDSTVRHELEFVIATGDRLRRLEIATDDGYAASDWIEIDVDPELLQFDLDSHDDSVPNGLSITPFDAAGSRRFAILRRLVTWDEYSRAMSRVPGWRPPSGEDSYPLSGFPIGASRHASSNAPFAELFCSCIGARLASRHELALASLDPRFEDGTDVDGVAAEWTGTHAPMSQEMRYCRDIGKASVASSAATHSPTERVTTLVRRRIPDLAAELRTAEGTSGIGFRPVRTLRPPD